MTTEDEPDEGESERRGADLLRQYMRAAEAAGVTFRFPIAADLREHFASPPPSFHLDRSELEVGQPASDPALLQLVEVVSAEAEDARADAKAAHDSRKAEAKKSRWTVGIAGAALVVAVASMIVQLAG